MKKFFTLFAAVVCGLAVNAKTIYLTPGVWADADAVLFAHSWTGEDGNVQDLQLTSAGSGVLSVEVPDGNEKIIFVRMPAGSTALDWNSKWDQTENLEIPSDKNMYVITDWHAGHWEVYGENPGPGPQPQGAYDYYLRGFFNGADTATPTPEELFENGILANFKFNGDDDNHKGYFYVMVCDAGQVVGRDYMLEKYVDGGTHVTLSDRESTGHSQKWGIPEGTVTFYLYDNEDGTLELSTEELPGKKLVGGGSGSTPGPEAVENTVVKTNARKAMIDGRLVIIRGEQMFDATGRAL